MRALLIISLVVALATASVEPSARYGFLTGNRTSADDCAVPGGIPLHGPLVDALARGCPNISSPLAQPCAALPGLHNAGCTGPGEHSTSLLGHANASDLFAARQLEFTLDSPYLLWSYHHLL